MLFPGLSNDDVLRSHVNAECQAPDPRTIAPKLSASFCNLLAGMLAKDRDCRYPTWDAVFEAVQRIENGELVPPPPPGVVSSVHLGA